MTVRSEATQVLTTVCNHGRPMAWRLYSPDDPEAQDWWEEERRAIPGDWSVELWPRDADFTFCEHCMVRLSGKGSAPKRPQRGKS